MNEGLEKEFTVILRLPWPALDGPLWCLITFTITVARHDDNICEDSNG